MSANPHKALWVFSAILALLIMLSAAAGALYYTNPTEKYMETKPLTWDRDTKRMVWRTHFERKTSKSIEAEYHVDMFSYSLGEDCEDRGTHIYQNSDGEFIEKYWDTPPELTECLDAGGKILVYQSHAMKFYGLKLRPVVHEFFIETE